MRLTEQPSLYDDLEKKSVAELLRDINEEDKKVPLAIEKVLPDLTRLISAIEHQLRNGGRMFYLGCGTGGRLSVLDAIELPNTYGIDPEMIQCVLAGGVENLVLALEEREDDIDEGWRTLQERHVSPKDIVVGISASGTTPFVLAALRQCREHGIPTGAFVNNPGSPISACADYPVEVITGPEFVTGSTRMKSGTSQKLICDMISTTVLIRLGRVEGNRMVNVRLINDKVVDRSVRMLMERNPSLTDYEFCKEAILKCGTVRKTEQYLREQDVLGITENPINLKTNSIMKKIISGLTAGCVFAALLFTGCSDSDDGDSGVVTKPVVKFETASDANLVKAVITSDIDLKSVVVSTSWGTGADAHSETVATITSFDNPKSYTYENRFTVPSGYLEMIVRRQGGEHAEPEHHRHDEAAGRDRHHHDRCYRCHVGRL